jgi:sulfate transport system ATP-binding protein
VAYVRAYDVELARTPNGRPAIETRLRHVRRFGPMVRLELDRVEDGSVIEAEVPREKFEALGLSPGDLVFVKPKAARLFPG